METKAHSEMSSLMTEGTPYDGLYVVEYLNTIPPPIAAGRGPILFRRGKRNKDRPNWLVR